MKMNNVLAGISFCLSLFAAGLLTSCRENPAAHNETVQVTADTSVVTKLGITTRPITDSLARIIAEAASTGKTISSTQKTDDGIVFFDVQEQVGTLVVEVKVRTSDGAILTITGIGRNCSNR
jgi:hypothetical protein